MEKKEGELLRVETNKNMTGQLEPMRNGTAGEADFIDLDIIESRTPGAIPTIGTGPGHRGNLVLPLRNCKEIVEPNS
jgi:hypothetical protein